MRCELGSLRWGRVLFGVMATGLLTMASWAQEAEKAPQEEVTEASWQRIDMAVVRIELSKDFRYGTGVSVEDLESKWKSTDIPGLCKDLEKFGKVTVVMQGESSSRVGEATEISSGSDEPMVQVAPVTGPRAPGYTQLSISHGLNASLWLSEGNKDMISLKYSIKVDDALPVALATGEGSTAQMVSRYRFDWSGSRELPSAGGLFAVKMLRGTGEPALEYFAVVRTSGLEEK